MHAVQKKIDPLKDVTLIIPSNSEGIDSLRQWSTILIDISSKVFQVYIVISGPRSHEVDLGFLKGALNVFVSNTPLYPGAARNLAITRVCTSYIAFLDVNTTPSAGWLDSSCRIIREKYFLGVFGQVKYLPYNLFSEVFVDSTYGRNPIHCIPGSIIHRDVFRAVGLFLPSVRSGEDAEWMIRSKLHHFNLRSACLPPVLYRIDRSISFKEIIRKWYRNYSLSGQIPLLYDLQKVAYLFFGCLILALLSLVWNWQVTGWNQSSILYIPYVSRSLIAVFASLYLFVRGIVVPLKKGIRKGLTLPVRLFLVLIFSFIIDSIKLLAFCYSLPKAWSNSSR
jgi:hypothetical protein